MAYGKNTIEAGHRTIIKRAMRAAGVMAENDEQTERLNSWARNNPRAVAKSLSRWFDAAARAWTRWNNQESSADESGRYRNQAESVIAAMTGGEVVVDYPGLYPAFVWKNRHYYGDDLERLLSDACATHRVTRDGAELYRGTEADCFGWLQRHQPASVHHATTHEGYAIERL